MAIAEMLLAELDQELAKTRKLLERVPEDKGEWRPHPRSMTLARLAGHVAELPFWAVQALEKDALDIAPAGARAVEPGVMKGRAELLAGFDRVVAAAHAALAKASDARLAEPWTLLAGGRTLFTEPRRAVIRTWVLDHTIHHRAQLGVYLRLNDVPLPSLYGPTADEAGM